MRRPSAGWVACTRVVVLDNLARRRAHARHLRSRAQSAVPRRAAALRRRRAALPRARIRIARGRSSRGVGHAQKTPLKGMRFESLEEAQAYLDHWEERWADTRIHGTTKRQVAAMFAEEKPALAAAAGRAFPLLPVRRAHGASGWLRGSRSRLLRRAAGLDRPARPGAVGSPAGAAAGSRRPASCCASTCARRAAAIASKTRTVPSKRRWAR